MRWIFLFIFWNFTISASIALAQSSDCPAFYWYCGHGERVRDDGCWSWRTQGCAPCNGFQALIDECQKLHPCDNANQWANGCDGPDPFPNSTTFLESCSTQSICYSTFYLTKEECDRDFARNLATTCKMRSHFWTSWETCIGKINRLFSSEAQSDYSEAKYDRLSGWAEVNCNPGL